MRNKVVLSHSSLVKILLIFALIGLPRDTLSATFRGTPEYITVHFEGARPSVTLNFLDALVTAVGRNSLIQWSPYIDEDGLAIGEILRSSGRLVNAPLTTTFNLYLCEHNTHICKYPPQARTEDGRRPDTTIWENIKAPAEAPPLSEHCPSYDNSLPRYAFCLPDLAVRQYLTNMSIKYDGNITKLISTIVTGTRGCPTWGAECVRIIQSLNRQGFANVLESIKAPRMRRRELERRLAHAELSVGEVELVLQEFPNHMSREGVPGKIRIPITAYNVSFTITSRSQLIKLQLFIEDKIEEFTRLSERLSSEERNSIYLTVSQPNLVYQQASLCSGFKDIKVAQESVLEGLLKMNFPHKAAASVEEQIINNTSVHPVTVGVWDQHVDVNHCELASEVERAVVLSQPINPVDDEAQDWAVNKNVGEHDPSSKDYESNLRGRRGRFPRAKECGAIKNAEHANPKYDHGTHVAGIIAARLNEYGIIGGNPLAKLWAYEFRASRLTKEGDPIMSALREANVMPLNVINMSYLFPGYSHPRHKTDLFKLIMGMDGTEGYKDTILFVAAAGNAAREISVPALCDVFPACWSLRELGPVSDSVISVVALRADGYTLHPESNYGRVFDVAAIGESISAYDGNYVGCMHGTSVAAPYVSALASLLYANTTKFLPPKAVKNRILYTSDFKQEWDGLFRFGRINFARALAIRSDRLFAKTGFCNDDECDQNLLERQESECEYPLPKDCTVTGNVSKGLVDTLTLTEGRLEDNSLIHRETPLRVKNIRRIQANGHNPDSRFWVVYIDDKMANTLRMVKNAKFKADDFLTYNLGNEKKRILISQVLEYTCSLWCK